MISIPVAPGTGFKYLFMGSIPVYLYMDKLSKYRLK